MIITIIIFNQVQVQTTSPKKKSYSTQLYFFLPPSSSLLSFLLYLPIFFLFLFPSFYLVLFYIHTLYTGEEVTQYFYYYSCSFVFFFLFHYLCFSACLGGTNNSLLHLYTVYFYLVSEVPCQYLLCLRSHSEAGQKQMIQSIVVRYEKILLCKKSLYYEIFQVIRFHQIQ